MTELSQWFEVELDDGVAVVRRTNKRYATSEDIEQAFTGLAARLKSTTGLRGQLTDLRSVVGRNDPTFEQTIARFRRLAFQAAPRNALVVRTAAGRLQVERHVEEDGLDARVFTDVDEALAYLRQP